MSLSIDLDWKGEDGRLEGGGGYPFGRGGIWGIWRYSGSGLVPAVGNIGRCSLLDPTLHRCGRNPIFANGPYGRHLISTPPLG